MLTRWTSGKTAALIISGLTLSVSAPFAAADPPPAEAQADAAAAVAVAVTGEADSADAVEQSFAKAAATPARRATEMIFEQRDAYLKDKGLGLGSSGNPGHAFIDWGVATVSHDPTHPSWAKSRQLAYEAAYINAQASYIQRMRSQLTVDTVREIAADDSDRSLLRGMDSEDEQTRASAIREKLLALTEAELDRLLIDLGVDPEQFDAKPKAQKVDLYTGELIKTTTTRAVRSLAGVRPLMTFEGVDDRGVHKIGVLIVQSPKLRSVAAMMQVDHAKPVTTAAGGPSILEQLPEDRSKLIADFGVRVLPDENGQLTVVSFGQWAARGGQGSDRAQERRRDNAFNAARDQAQAAMAEFANSTLSYTREQTVGEVVQEYLVKNPDGFVEEREIVEVIDKVRQSMKRRASLEITGIETVTTWSAPHPKHEHEIVGVVMMWNPSTAESVRQVERAIADPEAPVDGDEPEKKEGYELKGNEYKETF